MTYPLQPEEDKLSDIDLDKKDPEGEYSEKKR